MSSNFDATFRSLVLAWTEHEDLRGSMDLTASWESRRRLDDLRYRTALARKW